MAIILSDKFNFINNKSNERLKKLKLSIPTLDSSECKTLMGGDGYGYDFDGGDLPELVVTADDYRPDHSDYDYQDDILDDEQNDYGYDDSREYDNNDNLAPGGVSVKDVVETLPQSIQNYYNSLVEKGLLKSVTFGEINKVGHSIISKDGTFSIIIDIDPGINLEAWMYANVMQQELFHYFQYQTGIMKSVDDNHSPIEYQENLMGWMNNGTCGSFLGNQSEEFDEWLDSVVHDGSVDLDAFLDGVAQWYEGFIQNHSGEYAEDADLQYQDKIEGMNWEEVLEWYGYTINK